MNELIKQYTERFNDNFPLFLTRHLDDEEREALIRQCLESNKPYDPDLDDDADY